MPIVDSGDSSAERAVWTDEEFRERIREHPPSVKYVANVLHEERLSQAAVIEQTLLPRRTVRYALKELEEEGLLTSRRSVRDARKRVYELRQPE